MRRTVRALSAAVLAGAAFGAAGGTAAAADPAAEVAPGKARPGATVTVSVTCEGGGGQAPATLDASSPAFAEHTVRLTKVGQGTAGPAYRGTAQVAAGDTEKAYTEGNATDATAGTERTGASNVDGTCPAAGGGRARPWSAHFTIDRGDGSDVPPELGGTDFLRDDGVVSPGVGGTVPRGDDGSGVRADDGSVPRGDSGVVPPVAGGTAPPLGDDGTAPRGGDGSGVRGGDVTGSRGDDAVVPPVAGGTAPPLGDDGTAPRGGDGSGVRGGDVTGSRGDDGTGGRGGDVTGDRGDDATGPRGDDGTGSRGDGERPCAGGQVSCGGDGRTCGESKGASCEGGQECGGARAGDASCVPPGVQHGVEAGEGGAFTDSVPALVAGAVLIAAACAGAAYRLWGGRFRTDG
ncbi:hypothetical protein [Streptomyces sasae]|uniref:hypothetical protein n=1 Tax=Streptomyces sasae TaxID=1266772 RepID=UPI00292CFB06|nr:hypothetical protein [Streptomyces sasae]